MERLKTGAMPLQSFYSVALEIEWEQRAVREEIRTVSTVDANNYILEEGAWASPDLHSLSHISMSSVLQGLIKG